MAKFYGQIGFAGEPAETNPDVYTEDITEHYYSGDVTRDTRRSQSGENLNDNVVISNVISIIADPFAYKNIHTIRYVKWMGVCWKVSSIDVQRPRLLLTIGEVYNA